MINYQVLTGVAGMNVVAALERFCSEAYGDRAQFKYPARWSWVYARRGALYAVAWDDSTIVGFVGAMTVQAVLTGNVVSAAWSVDNFVLPAYRSQGIGTTLQQKAEAAIPITFSTWLSAENLHIKERLGNVKVCDLTILVTTKLPAPDHPYSVAEPRPDVLASVAEQSVSRYDLHVERSAEYCRWRFLDQPLSGYVQLSMDCGTSLLRACGPKRSGVGMIGDVFPVQADPYEAARLIRSSTNWLLSHGCSTVRFGTADPELLELLLISDSNWEVHGQYVILASDPHQQLAGCQLPFFSLSDSDVDQFPW